MIKISIVIAILAITAAVLVWSTQTKQVDQYANNEFYAIDGKDVEKGTFMTFMDYFDVPSEPEYSVRIAPNPFLQDETDKLPGDEAVYTLTHKKTGQEYQYIESYGPGNSGIMNVFTIQKIEEGE